MKPEDDDAAKADAALTDRNGVTGEDANFSWRDPTDPFAHFSAAQDAREKATAPDNELRTPPDENPADMERARDASPVTARLAVGEAPTSDAAPDGEVACTVCGFFSWHRAIETSAIVSCTNCGQPRYVPLRSRTPKPGTPT